MAAISLRQQYLACQHPKLIARFNAAWMPEPNSGCWLWLGTIENRKLPYGRFSLSAGAGRSRYIKAHRISFLIHVGPIPKRKHVLHKCHNTYCVNPQHLYIGTQAINMRDRSLANRNPQRKLTAEQAQQIYDLRGIETTRGLGARFGVSCTTVWQIWHGQNWQHHVRRARTPASTRHMFKRRGVP